MKKNFFGKKTVVLLIFAIFFAISCGGKHPAVKNFEKEMSILQSGDIEKMPNVKSNEEFKKLNEDTFETLKNGYKKITYKVNKVETDKNTAKINVTMKSPDLTNLVQDALQKIMSTSPNEMVGKSQEELNKIGEKSNNLLIEEKLDIIEQFLKNNENYSIETENLLIYTLFNYPLYLDNKDYKVKERIDKIEKAIKN